MPTALGRACAVMLVLTGAPGAWEPAQEPSIEGVRTLLDAGRYDDAEAQARALIGELNQLPADRRLTARQLEVEALVRNGRGAEARTLAAAKAVLAAAETDAGTPLADRGTSLRWLGLSQLEAGVYLEAVARLQAAVAAHERALGRDAIEVAEDLDGLARALRWLQRYDAALIAIDRSIAIATTRSPMADAMLARALTTRASLWQLKGRYPPARTDLERALAVRETLGPQHPDMARVLATYGDQLWFDNELARGRDYLARSVALAEATLRPDHPDIAIALRKLANLREALGELDQAKALRERSVGIAEATYGPEHPLFAYPLHDLALSYSARGDYGEALPRLHRALEILLQKLGPQFADIPTIQHNLADLHARIGDYAEAARLQRRALLAWERTVGATHPVVPWAQVGLADALASQGRYREAIVFYERALSTRRRTLGDDHIQVAATETALARSLLALGETARAAPLARDAVRIAEASGGAEYLSDALLISARLDAARGRHTNARREYERAIEIRTSVLGASHPSVAEARAGLAATLAALGERADGLAMALDAERIGHEHLRLATGYLPERQALAYASTRARGLDLAISMLRDGDDAGPVLDAAVRGRAVVLDEMARRQHLRTAAGDTLAPLWSAFVRASQRYANLVVAGPGDDEDTAKGYAATVERARREREEAEAALAARSDVIGRELAKRETGLDDIRARLPADSALVAYLRYSRSTFAPAGATAATTKEAPAYVAFVLRAGDPKPVVLPLGSASSFERLVTTWRRTATDGITPEGEALPGAERTLRQAGDALRARIWDPVAAHLAGIDRVFIVPDGALNFVPFAALPVARSQYLLDLSMTVHYLSAERDLAVDAPSTDTARRGLLALGGPAYGIVPPSRGSAPLETTSTTSGRAETRLARRDGCGTFETMTFPPLPASREEAEQVGALWRRLASGSDAAAGNATVLTAARADEAAFKRAGPGHRVLHLATHGFFLGIDCDAGPGATRAVTAKPASQAAAQVRPRIPDNPLLQSGLALAGANRRSSALAGAEDNILTAQEVAALDLDGVEWAVLSACDTGLGAIRAGEGVFGLQRAFRIAGARTIIMSLWPVEDRAARDWMRALYQGRLQDRRSTEDAVREASRRVLDQRRRQRASTHPFFWAGFVASGDWR